jgi:hypothetical protein
MSASSLRFSVVTMIAVPSTGCIGMPSPSYEALIVPHLNSSDMNNH